MEKEENSLGGEPNVENLLSLIREQTKEIKINKKKLEKLEEKFIKTNADFKNILNDKSNIEIFLKSIFPKEMHDNIIKIEYGLYDSVELSKMHLVCEAKKQNEFQQVLNKIKNENLEFSDKIKHLTKELESKSTELAANLKNNLTNMDQLNFYQKNYGEIVKKLEFCENEKNYLMKMIDEKNLEIESLIALEIENAELKAKKLLDNLEMGGNRNVKEGSKNQNNLNNTNNKNNCNFSNEGLCFKCKDKFSSPDENSLNRESNSPNGVYINGTQTLKIYSLNAGCQTSEKIFSQEHVLDLEKLIKEYKTKNEHLKKEFIEYKEKSHKILLSSEENYTKLLKENENLKKEISGMLNEAKNQISTSYHNETDKKHSSDVQILNELNNIKNSLHNYKTPNGSIDYQKISMEYLKNILLKYMEAISIGDEFQTKILENVIFTILSVSNDEKLKLEEKRSRSSFYYNLWYNAKAFLSAKIYGSGLEPNNFPDEIKKVSNEEDKQNEINIEL